MNHEDSNLPVIDCAADHDEPREACSPISYVSNEQAAIAEQMKLLHARAKDIKKKIAATTQSAENDRLESELNELRDQYKRLEVRREEAIHRKMVMLGHEPA